MNELEKLAVEVVTIGLGWPEGPTVLPDGRVVIVESYRSQLTAIDPRRNCSAVRLCCRSA